MSGYDWDGFVRRHWERSSTLLRGGEHGWRAPTEVVFATMQAAARAHREGDEVPWRAFVGDERLSDPAPWLPGEDDATYTDYAARLEGLAGGRPFTVILSVAQTRSFALWRLLRELLAPMFRRAGVPPYFVEASLVLGRYPATVFGLHRDLGTLLMYHCEGAKTLHVWPEAALTDEGVGAVQRVPDERAKLIATGTPLRGEPGDLAYCPAGDWHIAETHGTCLTLNIQLGTRGGNYYDPDAGGRLSDVVSGAVSEVLESSGLDGAPPLHFGPSPRAIATPSLGRALRWITTGRGARALAAQLQAYELTKSTGLGFNHLPPPAAAPAMRAGTHLVGDPAHPVEVARGADGSFLVSANGYVRASRPLGVLRRVVRRVNGGRPQRVGALLALAASSVERREARALLRDLLRWRAIEAVGRSDR